ncbi:hypothetical protein LSH36_910g00011 [Paralvinella palmiformis]|uniref:Uncharacterized protein n=1 Tax=Paralvinella palmiformis TaxID=53620 RepID=A0AAD9IYE6_9ANNE|nr:hypothetical protein LSH36_910g00011 [Paralvinella palmiformis]
MSNGQYVVGSGTYSCGLYKYNESCQIIWCNKTFIDVIDLTVNNNNDNIIVSYRNVGVFVIDSDGDFLLSISSSLSPPLSHTGGISVDKEGYLFICYFKSILLFNPQYKFVKKLVTTQYKPYHVALCDNKYLAICGEDIDIYCTNDNNETDSDIVDIYCTDDNN